MIPMIGTRRWDGTCTLVYTSFVFGLDLGGKLMKNKMLPLFHNRDDFLITETKVQIIYEEYL